MASGNVPTTALTAFYSNTTPGTVADPAVMDAAVQAIVQAINDNWAAFQTFLAAAEIGVADASVTTRKLRDGAVTQTKIIKEAITQFTYDFAQIDQKISDAVIAAIPQSTINAIANTVNSQLNTHMADYTLQVPYAVASGTANTYTISLPISTLTAGMAVAVKINVDSTGPSTLNWNGQGAKSIKKANGNDATNLKANGIYTLRYSGTDFILQGEGGEYGTVTAADVLSGKTFGTDPGVVPGAMPNNGALVIVPSYVDQTIPLGYHNGNGRVKASLPYASQFTTLDNYSKLATATVGTWVTILNVTGKGYLLEAYAYNFAEIKITVDGFVILWTYSSGGYLTGILNIDGQPGNNRAGKLLSDTASMPTGLIITSTIPTATRSASDNTSAIIGCPVFFNSSLKIEVTAVSSSGNALYYGIRGGYK